MASGSSEAFLDRLRQGLASPPLAADVHMLAQLFRIETVTVTVVRPPSFEDFPDLVLRVRGALGNALHALGPPPQRRSSSTALPRAWDVLQCDLLPGLPKPLVLQVDVVGTLIHIHAHLIGHGAYWLPDVEAALVAACDGGITLSNESRVKAVPEVVAVTRRTWAGFQPSPVSVSECRLKFITPLRLRSGLASKVSLPSLLISLANRIKGLAAWHGFALDLDWDSFHGQAWQLNLVSEDLAAYRWDRGSQRAGRRIPVLGVLGQLALTGELDLMVPLLQIGEIMNAGSHASLGLGRYRLILMP